MKRNGHFVEIFSDSNKGDDDLATDCRD